MSERSTPTVRAIQRSLDGHIIATTRNTTLGPVGPVRVRRDRFRWRRFGWLLLVSVAGGAWLALFLAYLTAALVI